VPAAVARDTAIVGREETMASENGKRVPRGMDYLTTVRSDQYIEIAPEQLGDGMERFAEMVTLVGAPLQPRVGNTDTIMERLEDGDFDQPIPTRLAAFANVSAAPIKLQGEGDLAGYYDLYATLSTIEESTGEVVFHTEDGRSGTFESQSRFWPLFELRPLGGGESLFVDTGEVPVPGFPMNLGSAGGHWSLRPPSRYSVRGFRSRPVFYEGEIIITVKRSNQDAPNPMKGGEELEPFIGGPGLVAACAKIQAEFVGREHGGTLARVGFPATKEFANIEVE
jgi:hypothetical protein